jgi:Holliday junction resolvasome RuvABC DNA-binding subunit
MAKRINLQKELARVREVEAEIMDRLANQSSDDKIKALEAAQPMIERDTPEMEALLAIGYKMDKAKAERIIAERERQPELWPYEVYEAALAFLAALTTEPKPISTVKPWRVGTGHARVRAVA